MEATQNWMTIPNLVTVTRLALVPVFVLLHFAGEVKTAAACFAFAMLTDGVDGLLARVLHQESKLGAFLDAFADKVLIFTALIVLVIDRGTPVWLLALIVFRDGAMAVGTIRVKRKNLELPTTPSRVGKYATFSLALYVLLALTATVWPNEARPYLWVVGYIAGLCVVVSTVQYFARFGHLFFDPGPAQFP